ncbi:MAG: thioredoxin domain-containing protein [Sphingobium sp.]
MTLLRNFALLFVAALTASAGPASGAPAKIDWTRVTTQSAIGGNILGNPAAPTRLVEYVSYTCGHCAHFVGEATQPLKDGWVRSGQVSIEIRNLFRDRYDFTAAMLARCGGKVRFMGNHEALFANQNDWMTKIEAYEVAPSTLAADAAPQIVIQDIADKTGLNALMMKRGYTAAQLHQCLIDPKAFAAIAAMTKYALEQVHATGTPTFVINDKVTDAHTWSDLKPLLPANRN